MIDPKLFRIAEQVIAKADREHPADAVLREQLKGQASLSRIGAGEISRAVFNYYRWLNWLDAGLPVAERIRQAVRLAEQFSKNTEMISPADLAAKAIPAWVQGQVQVSPEWLKMLQLEPRLWLRTKPGQRDALGNKLGSSFAPESELLEDSLEYLGTEDLFRASEFHSGEFELQDISSQAVMIAADPKPGQTWWDACAGEGGKTMHMSDLMQNKGLIWASDRADWRLKKLKQRAARAKVFNYRTAAWNGGDKLPTKTKFDGILVDAPCSGIGTWQRNPHARWTTTLEDVLELAQVQFNLLKNASTLAKPGGRLIFSVCTLAKAETTDVAEKFTAAFPDFRPLPLKNPFRPANPPQSQLWFWPQDTGGNGMFVAAWERKQASKG